MRRPLLAVALLLIAPMAIAQVYKWTDAHGTVHYSESPPPHGQHYKQITLTGSAEPIAQPSSPAPESANPDTAGAATSQPVADTPENRTKLCTSLKANLSTLKGSGPVVIEENGQQKVLNDAQRKQQIATATSQYQQYCAGQ